MTIHGLILGALLGAGLLGCGAKPSTSAGAPKAPTPIIKTIVEPASGSASASGSGVPGPVPTTSGSGTGTASTSGSEGPPEVIDTGTGSAPEVVINLEPVDGAAMQVKNIYLLRSSISDCLNIEANATMLNITYDMKLGQSPAPVEKGKVQFYNGDCPVGADITTCLKNDLYDPDAVAGDTVSSNGLSVNYMQALGTVANVAAHNCDTDSKCKCDDPKVAEGLIARCVPYLTDTNFDKAAAFLVQTCTATGTQGETARARRNGIANLIGSVGFAKARE